MLKGTELVSTLSTPARRAFCSSLHVGRLRNSDRPQDLGTGSDPNVRSRHPPLGDMDVDQTQPCGSLPTLSCLPPDGHALLTAWPRLVAKQV